MDRFLRRDDVCTITGLGKTRLYDLEREGDFPRRKRIGERARGWLESEVQEWIASRPAAPRAKSNGKKRPKPIARLAKAVRKKAARKRARARP